MSLDKKVLIFHVLVALMGGISLFNVNKNELVPRPKTTITRITTIAHLPWAKISPSKFDFV